MARGGRGTGEGAVEGGKGSEGRSRAGRNRDVWSEVGRSALVSERK